MPAYVKDGGTWRTPNGVFVRVAGTWRRVNLVYVKVEGTWRISFADAFSFNISGSLVDVNLRNAALAAGWNGVASVTATVTSGSVLNASSNYGLVINGSFPNGVSLINNGGYIVGRGGVGGKGGDGRGDLQIAYGGAPGGGGGHGLYADVPVTIFNYGIIAGGGGGGGGGGSTIANQYATIEPNPKTGEGGGTYLRRQAVAGGGGGGAGRSNNFGSAGGARGERVRGAVASIGNISILDDAFAGGGGNLSTQGGGGYRGEEVDPGDAHALGGSGGAGGFWGSAGGSGGNSGYVWPGGLTSSGAGGGAGGLAVVGNGNITWGATGERYGGIV